MVGPKGYIHGWIFTGAPGVGAHVFHPYHGHGTVSAAGGGHATVRFHSGAEHSFEVRPGSGPPKLEPRSGPESSKPEWQRVMEEQAAKSTAAAESNAAAMTGMMRKHREGQQRLMKALGFVAPHVADMKLMHSQGEYGQAVDLLHEGNYAAAVAMLDKAAGVERDRRNPGAAARLDKLSAKVAKAAAKLGVAARAAGMVTNPGGTERLHQYWVHGEGAAKIRWGSPGDFDRCVLHLGKFIKDPKGYCNLAHHAALGIYPATHAAEIKHATGRSTVSEPAYDADGLDQSWDSDDGDLPDLTGLTVDQLEAADTESGGAPEPPEAQRAMPKLGTGARFKKLKSSLAAKGAKDPGALAAYIGRKKFGKGKFTKLAAKARGGGGRAESLVPFARSVALEDISIRSGGDGRTVEAYAAVFNIPVDIHDQDGDYTEVLDPSVFNRAISDAAPQGTRKGWRIGVFYNHGRTIMGTPSERYSMPVGKILDIKADDRGLWTEIRYNRTPVADEVLENIREGSPGGYSFSGMFRRSSPLIPRGGFCRDRRTGQLPVVHRTESTLKELGWTPFPAYEKAEVVGMRALFGAMADDPDFAYRMFSMFRDGAPLDSPPLPGAPPDGDSPAEDSHPPLLVRSGRSVRQEMQAARSAFLQRHRRQQ